VYKTGGLVRMSLKKGILKSFNSGNYKATVQIAGSNRVYLEGISVARNIPAVEMALGRKVGVIFFDEYNARESVIIAVYT
jgi:CRISPR/Cas system-associated endonuclease Cas1